MFDRNKFDPRPEVGDLVIGDGGLQVGIEEVFSKGPVGEWKVLCNDGEIRFVIAQWNACDEEMDLVEENHWWQDCASRAVPWWE